MAKRSNKTDQSTTAVSATSVTCANSTSAAYSADCVTTDCSSLISNVSSSLTYIGSVDTTNGKKNVITTSPSTGITADLALQTMDCTELDCGTIIATDKANINGYYQPSITTVTEPYYYPWTGIGLSSAGNYSLSVDLSGVTWDNGEFKLKSNRKRIYLKFNL